MDANLCTEQWQRTILKKSRLLKQIQERIADEIKVTRITKSEQLNVLQNWKGVFTNQIKADIEQCSGQLLAPLLSEIHASLPLEIRENIYEHVFDVSEPIVIPRMEDPNVKIMNGRIQSGSAGASEHVEAMREELNPFMQDYCFSVAVMGSSVSTEFQNLALRKTPFYFRGSRTSLNVRQLLNTEIRPGVYFRDLVRHLRVYLRSNAAFHDAEDVATGVSRAQIASYSEHVTLDVPSTCAMYLDRLEGLKTLNYTNHTVGLELCFLAPIAGPGGILHEPSIKRNLYEMVGSVYRRARDGGADVKVRYERFSTGGGEDWTEYLERGRRDAVQSKQQQQHAFCDGPLAASSLHDLFNTPILVSEGNISWQHGFIFKYFNECGCRPCTQDRPRISTRVVHCFMPPTMLLSSSVRR